MTRRERQNNNGSSAEFNKKNEMAYSAYENRQKSIMPETYAGNKQDTPIKVSWSGSASDL